MIIDYSSIFVFYIFIFIILLYLLLKIRCPELCHFEYNALNKRYCIRLIKINIF